MTKALHTYRQGPEVSANVVIHLFIFLSSQDMRSSVGASYEAMVPVAHFLPSLDNQMMNVHVPTSRLWGSGRCEVFRFKIEIRKKLQSPPSVPLYCGIVWNSAVLPQNDATNITT